MRKPRRYYRHPELTGLKDAAYRKRWIIKWHRKNIDRGLRVDGKPRKRHPLTEEERRAKRAALARRWRRRKARENVLAGLTCKGYPRRTVDVGRAWKVVREEFTKRTK